MRCDQRLTKWLNVVNRQEPEKMAKVHQEVTFSAPPAQVYRALIQSAEHARFTGAPAEIGTEEGAAWSAYGGKISGRHVELVDGVRIVQTWRAGNWPEGMHSLVRFELSASDGGTKLVLDHDALGDEQVPHIDGGWEKMYWEPLRKYLGA
jgi:uncharacterized protein YndB with AHSA1/START domain